MDDWKSQAAYLLTMDGTAVSWRALKLDETLLSTTEAEYCAASDAAAEAKGLVNLLKEIKYNQNLHQQQGCSRNH